MADSDFRVKAIIEANTSNFDKGMKQAQASATNLSNTFGNLSKIITKALSFTGIAIGTKAIADFGKSCVQSANQGIKQFNILDNTVKATGADAWTSIGELENASKALSDSTNYSVTEIQKMQSVLLGFTNITGEAFDGASEAVLDMATVMGMDLTSAVQTVGKALDDPITGLDSLRRQGFKFTDEQKAELAQLVKNGKQLEAQKIILDTLSISYGGASKAGQDSFAKQRHAVENFSDTLGTKLIPVMKVFAEDNAEMINSLRELIENMDFTPVINVVTNLKKIFAETFNTISGYLRNVGNDISDFISRFNFKPIISVLDTLIGALSGVISKFKEINSQKLEIFDKLKEALIDFSNSETFQNIINFVNKIIDAVFFLWSEIQDIGSEIRDLIVNKIIEIWNKIKELFQNGQNALSASGQDIASWGDLFYDILNNTFRSFQDLFGMIKALIHGDWTVAWEYAKLTVMRVADSILDLISTIANAFPNLINGMIEELNKLITEINKVRGWFGKDPLGLVSAFESVDLSKKSGLEDKIKETENKIQELTGKSADITIKNLQGVSTKFSGFTQHALGEIGKLTEGVATNSEKQKQYFSSTFSSTEKDTKSTYKKFSEWDSKLLQQRLEDLDEWSNKYHQIQLDLIEIERQRALDADKSGAEAKKINEYYNRQIEKENERSAKARLSALSNIGDVFVNQMRNAWKKFMDYLNKDDDFYKSIVDKIKNVKDKIQGKIKDIGKLIYDNTVGKIIDLIPDSVKKVFSNISGMIKGVVKQLVKFLQPVVKFCAGLVTTIGKLFVNGVKAYIKMMKTAIDTIFKILKSAFDVFKELINFNISDALDILLNFEDSVLTFFVETLPKLPEFVSTVLKSINIMLSTLINSVKAENVATVIYGILNELANNLPNIVQNILTIIQNMISFSNENLADIIYKFLKILEENAISVIEGLLDLLTNIIKDSIDGLYRWLDEGGLESLLKLALKIQTSVQDIFMKLLTSVADLLENHTDDVTKFISDSLQKAMEDLPKLVDALLRIVNSLIKSVADLFKDKKFVDTMVQSMIDTFNSLMDRLPDIVGSVVDLILSLITALVPKLPEIILAVITKIVETIPKIINEIVGKIGSVISDIFQKIFTVEFWQNVFGKIGEGFQKIFESLGKGLEEAFTKGGYGKNSTGSTVGDLAVDALVPFGFLRHFFATGTNDAPSGLALVGEAGPELVKFRGGEQVLNSHNTQKALEGMGGTTINQNVTFNNLQDTTAFAMLQQLKQYNRQMAINGII